MKFVLLLVLLLSSLNTALAYYRFEENDVPELTTRLFQRKDVLIAVSHKPETYAYGLLIDQSTFEFESDGYSDSRFHRFVVNFDAYYKGSSEKETFKCTFLVAEDGFPIIRRYVLTLDDCEDRDFKAHGSLYRDSEDIPSYYLNGNAKRKTIIKNQDGSIGWIESSSSQ